MPLAFVVLPLVLVGRAERAERAEQAVWAAEEEAGAVVRNSQLQQGRSAVGSGNHTHHERLSMQLQRQREPCGSERGEEHCP